AVSRIGRCARAPDIISGAATGTATKYECLGDGVAGKPVGTIGAPDRLTSGEQAGQIRLHLRVGDDAAHVVMRDRCELDWHLGEIDTIGCEAIDHRPEGFAQGAFRAVLKAEINPAVRRAAAGFHLLKGPVTADGLAGV